MPGMMETILNLGMNDAVIEQADPSAVHFLLDDYRRLIQMYGDVVAGIDGQLFADAFDAFEAIEEGAPGHDDLKALVDTFKGVYKTATGSDFPQDPHEQLFTAVAAVFDSWNAPRAVVYRAQAGIPDDAGTAANVVQMVFGNRDSMSATGVCFSRDPATGQPGLYGEFLPEAQGEDIVAGTRTPLPVIEMKQILPEAHAQLVAAVASLEHHYRDVQDVEFTVESGHFYLLQTRGAKRTATAALRFAVDMESEGLLTRTEAVQRIDSAQLEQLLHPTIDPKANLVVVATGLSASPGAACGIAIFDADTAAARAADGEDIVLVRPETTADDIHGLLPAQGILTARGGMTSHAAVVARGLGKPCVAGCAALDIDLDARIAKIGDAVLREGEPVTINGSTGEVILGLAPLVEPEPDANLATILEWADDARRMKVYANADTPLDATRARKHGAEGIGLCRTEHMFMAQDRLADRARDDPRVDHGGARNSARTAPADAAVGTSIEGSFEAMVGLPVTIRLLDPPLHEFLPDPSEVEDMKIRERIEALREANPMLGTRGCRLGIERPEIYEMQIKAIVRAALAVEKQTGVLPIVEIMHPLVAFGSELRAARRDDRSHRRRRGRYGLQGRHDDRAAEGSAACRRAGRACGVLLLRDERPHADDTRRLSRRRPGSVPDLLSPARAARDRPLPDDRRRGSGRELAPPSSAAARPARRSRSGSAASTGETPPRSPSARASASTTCPARPSVSRWRGSRRRRRFYPPESHTCRQAGESRSTSNIDRERLGALPARLRRRKELSNVIDGDRTLGLGNAAPERRDRRAPSSEHRRA